MALDLAGFGHTRGGSRSTSVQANQRLLHRFLTEVAGVPAILVGNSMGGLISILQASQRPDTVAGLVLVDPALPPALNARPDPRVFATFAAFLVPVVGRRVLSRRRDAQSAEEAAHALLRLCCADMSRVPSDIVDLHVELAGKRREYPDVDSEMLAAAQSLMWVLADRRRLAAMQRSIDVPVLLLHGDKDRLVHIATARAAAAANPSWQFEVARGVGHVPQLEVPAVDGGQDPRLARRPPAGRRPRRPGATPHHGPELTTMERLSSLDAGFLDLENDRQQMHVGSLLLFEGPVPAFEEFTAHLESCLDLVPRYRQRVQRMPLGLARPAWVDDPHFSLAYHLRHTAIPSPGGDAQLRALVSRVLSQRLDVDRPLWEMWLVEGLPDERWAIITKTHHAMIDGLAGNELMEIVLDRDRDAPRRTAH